MQRIFFLLSFCFLAFQCQGQISTIYVNQGCSYNDPLTEKDLYLYEPSNEAERIVTEIVDALGLTKNFTVRSSNVPNALATTFNGTRYIFYSTDFLEKFKADANTQWAAYAVLAHEIGHHLNGHNFGEADPRTRKMLELEADQFSGSVLRMMGATIDDVQAGLLTFGFQGETKTHPPINARKEAVSSGWKKRDEWLRDRTLTPQRGENNPEQELLPRTNLDSLALAKSWFDKALAETDKIKQMEYYTKAIQFDPNYTYAYVNRGSVKSDLNRPNEAIADFDKAIQLNPNNEMAYGNRGNSKNDLGNYFEAIIDFSKAIKIAPYQSYNYNGRGVSYYRLGKNTEAIADFDEAIKLNPTYAKPYANKGCALVKIGRYKKAVDSINEALKLDSTLIFAYDCRAEALKALGKD